MVDISKNRRGLSLIIGIIVFFIGLKGVTNLLSILYVDGGVVYLGLYTILGALFLLVFAGGIFGLIWSLLFSSPSDSEVKIIGGGTFGITVFSGICFGGGCLPAAVFGGAISILYILPALLGFKIVTAVLANVKNTTAA
jgi:hypothetical protein